MSVTVCTMRCVLSVVITLTYLLAASWSIISPLPCLLLFFFFFFFNDPAPTEFSPLPLPAALPIPAASSRPPRRRAAFRISGEPAIRYGAGIAASCWAYHAGLLVLPTRRVVPASSGSSRPRARGKIGRAHV